MPPAGEKDRVLGMTLPFKPGRIDICVVLDYASHNFIVRSFTCLTGQADM